MKILVYEWANYLKDSLRHLCKDHGIDRDDFTWAFKQDTYDEEFLKWFADNIESKKYDFVLSINYWPMLAIACDRAGLKYAAWCYDCPLNITAPEDTFGLTGNRIFLFDYAQYLTFHNMGFDTVYHLPLGADASKCLAFSSKSHSFAKYDADISFVGSLYESQLPLITSLLNEDTKSLLNEIIRNQEQLYNYNLIDECLTDDFIDYLNGQYIKALEGSASSFSISKKALSFALASEVTRRNRLVLLNLLGRKFDTRLYSFQTFDMLEGIKQCGTVDYNLEMPHVFAHSKINLNPCLRCINSGIPLRAFDIMGYGGFLLSSYQQELADMYIDGVEMVLYDSYEDCLDKATFYLANASAREKIATAGRKKTLEEHTLDHAFNRILLEIGNN